ncbi:ABC transporter permease [uncultured Cellulomonas sp.]|uniref:ABC transporter permease n=1 Tax=uncultured Cellulomonas sp. TaxID=189682 RepID=UPI002605174C|nr:ABC transporter permease [uncultured Cellulomonas sp.]
MRGNVVWMVARREIITRMLTKANIISMVVMLVVILAGAGVGRYFLEREQGPEATRIAVDQAAAALGEPIAAAAGPDVDLEVVTMTDDEARAALADTDAEEQLDAFVVGDPASPRVVVAEQADAQVLDTVTAAVRAYVVADQIGELGGDPAAFEQAMAAAVPQVEALDPPDAGFDGAAFGIATVMISLLLFALIGSGSMIAMGVVEEKTSRVVEILLSTIKPTQLLAGKIVGIGIYGLFQVVVLGAALVVATRILGVDGISVDIGSAMIWLVVWFLLGYLLFALLFGGFAALVSRQEDIGSVTTPLMFLLFVPFYVTMFLVPNDPDSTLVRVLSQVPFFAPFMMPVRDAFGALDGWEMPLAIAIAAVTIPVLIWLAARVYQRGVLHTGGRMKLTEALRG